jgi:hypothetical protein
MNRPQRNHPMLFALGLGLAAGASILSGCGGGVSDKDQIAAIVKQEGSNPATVCDHLTNALLARFGSKRSCLRVAASSAKDRSTHTTGIRVRGDTATAVVSDRSGNRAITFVKQQGVWKVSGAQ